MWCSHRLKNSMSRDRKRAADGVTGVQTCALPIYARNLAQPDHLLLWQVGHVHLAVERQHVVLAQAEELDVPHHHHFVVLHLVQRSIQNLLDVHSKTAGQEAQGLVHTLGRTRQAIALRVLAQAAQHLFDQRSDRLIPCLRLHHLDYSFIRFHRLSLQRCSAPSRRCESSPASATRPETLASNSVSACGRSQTPDSPTSAPHGQTPPLPGSGCGGRTAAPLPAAPVHRARRCPPPGPSPHRAARARSLPPRSCVRGRGDCCTCRTAGDSLPRSTPRNAGGARRRTYSVALRGTRWLSEIIHVQFRRLVHADGVELPAAAAQARLQPD